VKKSRRFDKFSAQAHEEHGEDQIQAKSRSRDSTYQVWAAPVAVSVIAATNLAGPAALARRRASVASSGCGGESKGHTDATYPACIADVVNLVEPHQGPHGLKPTALIAHG
jgi:hypothetical protein